MPTDAHLRIIKINIKTDSDILGLYNTILR